MTEVLEAPVLHIEIPPRALSDVTCASAVIEGPGVPAHRTLRLSSTEHRSSITTSRPLTRTQCEASVRGTAACVEPSGVISDLGWGRAAGVSLCGPRA